MKTIINNENAQAGVGTLIIFIAMVLVAAVAAAVLIQTSGVMQSKSTSTTKEAAAAIGENIVVESVDGYKATTTASNLKILNVTIKVAAGGSDIDLSKVLIKVNSKNFNYSSNVSQMDTTTASVFYVYSLRESTTGGTDISSNGPNTYMSSSTVVPVLKAGGLARLDVLVNSSVTIQAKSPITLALTPEKGATFNLPLTVPALGSDYSVGIYP